MNPIFELKGKGRKLTVFDDSLVLENKGVLGFLTQGLSGAKTIPMESIKSVQFRKGGIFVNGFIQFGIAGGIEKRGGVLGATDDENSVVFTKSENKLAEQIKIFVERKIANGKSGATTIVQQTSSADEIKKYKDLFDQGVISEEEFAAKKKKLLEL